VLLVGVAFPPPLRFISFHLLPHFPLLSLESGQTKLYQPLNILLQPLQVVPHLSAPSLSFPTLINLDLLSTSNPRKWTRRALRTLLRCVCPPSLHPCMLTRLPVGLSFEQDRF
jgi:hypothetical protein